MDYLVEDGDIDNQRICVIGHSRRGKTALLAAALDERIALAVPHQSGTGGCALSRNNDQETVERINRVFPHWFNDNFLKFNNNEDPTSFRSAFIDRVDGSPAPLGYSRIERHMANYESALRALKAADQVYEFLGLEGLVGDGVVVGDEPIVGENFGQLLQYRRDTVHTLNIDYWNKILDFADKHFEKRTYAAPILKQRASPWKDGFLIDEGRRWFPIGFYELPEDDADLRAMADAGVNLVRCRSWADLDRAQNVGMMGVVPISLQSGASGPFLEQVYSMIYHPALAVWEGPDEIVWNFTAASSLFRTRKIHKIPSAWWKQTDIAVAYAERQASAIIPKMREAVQAIRSLDDRNRPVWINEALESDLLYR